MNPTRENLHPRVPALEQDNNISSATYPTHLLATDLQFRLNESYLREWLKITPNEKIESTKNFVSTGDILDIYLFGVDRGETGESSAFSVLQAIQKHYSSQGWLQITQQSGRRGRTEDYILSAELQASGIEIIGSSSDFRYSEFRSIEPNSLLSSMANGSIRHISGLTDEDLHFLKEYCDDRFDQFITIPELEPLTIQQVIDIMGLPLAFTPNGKNFYEFFADAFSEAKPKAFQGKHLQGPYYEGITNLLQDINSQLLSIHPDLTPQHLHASSYRPATARQIKWDSGLQMMDYKNLYYTKCYYFRELSETYNDKEKNTSLPPGLLQNPTYRRQNDPTTCVSTCFRMVFEDITGGWVEEDEIKKSIVRAHQESHVDQEEYLKIFETDAFREEYGIDVRTISFTGMSLGAIEKITKKLKQQDPNYRITCVINLQTESATDPNIWHANVLTSFDNTYVTCHDPSPMVELGRANKSIDKTEFIKRWAVAYNTGYLVITKDDN